MHPLQRRSPFPSLHLIIKRLLLLAIRHRNILKIANFCPPMPRISDKNVSHKGVPAWAGPCRSNLLYRALRAERRRIFGPDFRMFADSENVRNFYEMFTILKTNVCEI